MLNSMTVTKFLGATSGALMVYLALVWATNSYYASPTVHAAAQQANSTAPAAEEAPAEEAAAAEPAAAEPAAEAPAADTATAEPAAEPAATETATAEPAAEPATTEAAAPAADSGFAAMVAAADVEAGKKVFGKCKSCHLLTGKNAVGPHLNGVIDRPRATVEGFKYSEAMLSGQGEPWTLDTLNIYLTAPAKYVPKTKMSFAGLPKEEDRAAVLAYIATFQ